MGEQLETPADELLETPFIERLEHKAERAFMQLVLVEVET